MSKKRTSGEQGGRERGRTKHPLAEVFGFAVDNHSTTANRYRKHKLCPFNNHVPNCTKDKANAPLGTCSIRQGNQVVITCPVRFQEDWLILEDAARLFFPPDAQWTSLTQVKLKDKNGESAGNIDIVLVQYDDRGQVIDFGAIEVQSVYITGNIRKPFEHYLKNPSRHATMDWSHEPNYPRADFLSSSRKRLAPQLIYKGGILHAWKKKLAVVLDDGFFNTLPRFSPVEPKQSELAWMIYELKKDSRQQGYRLSLKDICHTRFTHSLEKITRSDAGSVAVFMAHLQGKLDEKLDSQHVNRRVSLDQLM
jgi:hypothetical protein